jgi:hypothetical protein
VYKVDLPNPLIAVSRLITRKIPSISITNCGNYVSTKGRTASALHRTIAIGDVAHFSFVKSWGGTGQKREDQAEEGRNRLHVGK